MSYEYKMVQMPPDIYVRTATGGEAAAYLEKIVSEHVRKGWEFYRVDSIGVKERPGCLASILGARAQDYIYYVVTFRKQIGSTDLERVASALNRLQNPAQSINSETSSPATDTISIQSSTPSLPTSQAAPEKTHITLQATVIENKTPVRGLPRTFDVKKELAAQSTIQIIGRTEDESWVLLGDKSGWVETSKLDIEGDLSSLEALRK